MRTPRALPVAVAVALLGGCTARASTADYPWYADAAALYAAADLVIIGTPDGGERRDVALAESGERLPHHVYTVTVTRVFKGGSAPGAAVLVKQTVDGAAADDTGLVGDEPALMFLEVYDEVPASLLSPTQGWYRIDAAGEPVAVADNPVPVTLAQLVRLAERR